MSEEILTSWDEPAEEPTPAPPESVQVEERVYVADRSFLHALGEFHDGVGYPLDPADAQGLVDAGLLVERA